MFAQLLGMGRANKKDKDKDKDKEKGGSSNNENAKEETEDEKAKQASIPQTEGRLVECVKKAKDVVSEGVAAKGQRLAPPKATLASASALVSAGAISGESPPGGGTNATNRSSVAGDAPGCECCGRNAGGEGSKAGGVAGVGGAASVGTVCPMSSGVDHTSGYGTRSMVPAPPAGPAGSLPSAASSVAPEPLSLKAFVTEVEAVDRGLHIQPGDAGAETEPQLRDKQLEAAKRLRHLISSNKEKIIQELLQRGWVPHLLRWLGLVHRPSLQVEALWALTNIAQSTSEHTPLLLKLVSVAFVEPSDWMSPFVTFCIQHGAVDMLVGLLKSPSLEVVEQAMWVLGNMAQDGQDGTAARDAVLQAGALGHLVRCMEQHPSLISLQRIGAWSLCNLFDGQPRPTVDVPTVNTVMPAINRLLRSRDSEVLSHACSALSHLCDGSAAHIKVVVESGVCKRLVELLDHPNWRVVKPALRTIGNVVCAEDDADYTEAILEAGSVACLKKLIAHPNREIQKEACWTLSNIAAGSVSQIQSVLDSGAMPQLIKLATSADTESEVRSEAFWVVLNAASCGSDAQIEYLVSQGCVQILSDLLGENSMVMMALEGIERVLSVGDLRVVRNAIASHIHTDQQGGRNANVDGGAHCVDCANVAGVGAAVGAAEAAAAVTGDSNSGGGLTPDAGAYTNPYACMLTPEKIQALEGHKDSAIAKRANRVWARYFVTCAICRQSFSRHGSSATFCTECKCHVCENCDCNVFHLDYQDKLWQEMEGKERKGKQAQQAAKKNKKAKKREKKKLASKDMGKADSGRANEAANGEGVRSHASKHAREAREAGADSPREASRDKPAHVGHPGDKESQSSASTESNSEDEDNSPSSPRGHVGATTSTSAATVFLNATTAAVTAAVKAATPAASAVSRSREEGEKAKSEKKTPPTPTPASTSTSIPTTSRATVSTVSATLVASTAAANGAPKGEGSQRRGAGDKRGKRDERSSTSSGTGENGQSSVKALPLPSVSAHPSRGGSAGNGGGKSSSRGSNGGGGGRNQDDDNEEPWVVVGGKGAAPPSANAGGGRLSNGNGTGAGSAKVAKRKKGQRDSSSSAGSAPGAAAAGPPGAGGGSVVEWASESGPSSVKVMSRAKTVPPSPSVKPVNSVAYTGVPAGTSSASVARVVSQSALPGAGSSGGTRIGNPWGVPLKVPSTQVATKAASPTLAVNGFRSVNGTKVTQPGPRRPGPGPGSVWGAIPVMTEKKTTSSTASVISASISKGSLSRPPGPTPRAGVIGPPPSTPGKQQSRPSALTPFKTLGSSALLPAVEAVAQRPPLGSTNRVSSPVGSGNAGGGRAGGAGEGHRNGVIGGVGGGGGSISVVGGKPTAAATPPTVPSKQRATIANGPLRNCSGGGDGEALVENERLVSFLMETGSILALAQRLEEEEEYRLAAPSPASSGPR